ncbi:MAG: exodeoxyribonuclease-3 [Porticoccus sp.]|jgi:exodeoxyribonuclease-3
MRVISFCADGIKTAAENGFYDWVSQQDADFICIQDLRAQEYELQADLFHPQGYFGYFFDSPSPATNGVAIYVKDMPKAIMTGLGFGEDDMEARYIQADYDHISIGCLLAPQAAAGDTDGLERKAKFYERYHNHLNKIRNKRREYIICGSWFIAHRDEDVQSLNGAAGKYGFLDEERQWLDILYRDLGYSDAFRRINSDHDEFTWWPDSNRAANGWRTDFQIISSGVRNRVDYGAIYKSKEFSSHAPLIMDYELEI